MAERKALVRFEAAGDAQVRDAINRTADEAEKAGKRSAAAADKIGKAIGVALAAGATSAALLIKRAIDAGDALDNMSQRTGVSVETLSRLDVVAKLSDTSLEALQKGMSRLASVQLEAMRGGKEQIAQLAAFGLTVEDLRNMHPEEVLLKISDGLAAVEDPALRSALAAKVFGKELGVELLPLLSRGSKDFEAMTQKADDLGYTMSAETAAASAALRNEFTLMGIGVDGIFRQVAKDLLPTMSELAAKFNDPAFREGIQSIITGAANAVVKLVELGAELGNIARWAGEEVAVTFNGVSGDDIVRLEDQAAGLRKRLEAQRERFVLIDIGGAEGKLEAQLASVETKIADFYARQEQARKAAAPKPEEEASTENPADAAKAYLDALKAQEEAERKAAEGRRAAAEAARAKAIAERELQRIMEEQQQAAADFQASLEDLRAEAGGPVVQAYLDYQREVIRLNELHLQGKVNTDDLTEALRLLTEQRDREVEALQSRLTPAQEVLAQLREELALMGMTRQERDKYFARQAMGPDATPEELAEADALVDERERAGQLADGMDFLREQGVNLLEDWGSGVKDWGDSVEDVLDNLRAKLIRMAAEKLIEMAFGQQGTTGTGASGGGWAGQALGWLGSLFGGGSAKGNAFLGGNQVEAFALGGIPDGPKMFPMARGRWGVMNEELDQEAIVPLKRGADGRLGVQMTGGGGMGDVHIGQIVMQAETDRSSAGQRSQQLGLDIQRELARSGR